MHPEPSLFFSNEAEEPLKEKAIVFIRNIPDNKTQVNINESNDNDVIFFELAKNPLIQLKNISELTYLPILEAMEDKEWGDIDDETKEEFLQYARKFAQEA